MCNPWRKRDCDVKFGKELRSLALSPDDSFVLISDADNKADSRGRGDLKRFNAIRKVVLATRKVTTLKLVNDKAWPVWEGRILAPDAGRRTALS